MIQAAVETELSVLYNCTRNHSLPEFYFSRIHWPRFLSAWSKSTNSGLRITCQLLGSCFALAFPPDEQNMYDMNSDDLSTLSKALENAAHSPDSTAEAFGYSYSALELVNALHSLSRSRVNLSYIAQAPLLVPLSNLIQRGTVKEKVSSLRLLWKILEYPEVKYCMTASHKEVLEVIDKESEGESEEIRLWSKGIIAAIHNHEDNGEHANYCVSMCCCMKSTSSRNEVLNGMAVNHALLLNYSL